jgi:hypothetical protein
MNIVSREKTEDATEPQPRIVTNFSDYSPFFDAKAVASRMIASIPRNYLYGLDAIVLTNMDSLSRKRQTSVTKSRKRKVRIGQAAGLYHGKWQGKPAWIEIFVDKTMVGMDARKWYFRLPFMRDFAFSSVLFHEIGHHIHDTAQPEFREKEDVADKWKVKLQRRYFRSRYPWLGMLAPILKPLLKRFLRKQARSTA